MRLHVGKLAFPQPFLETIYYLNLISTIFLNWLHHHNDLPPNDLTTSQLTISLLPSIYFAIMKQFQNSVFLPLNDPTM